MSVPTGYWTVRREKYLCIALKQAINYSYLSAHRMISSLSSADASRKALGKLGLEVTKDRRTVTLNKYSSERNIVLLVPGSGHADETVQSGTNSCQGNDEIVPEGLVPSGLWSSAKFAEEAGLDIASMVQYIQWALNHDIQPVVLRGNTESDIEETLNILHESFSNTTRRVAVVAHSEGGASVVRLLQKKPWLFCIDSKQQPVEDSKQRTTLVHCVALLDSVHTAKDIPHVRTPGANFLQNKEKGQNRCINWVQSSEPLDSIKPKPWVKNGVSGCCPVRSAGTSDHLRVPAAAMSSVLHFIKVWILQNSDTTMETATDGMSQPSDLQDERDLES